MTKEEKSKIKYRMKCLARKFCKKNDVYRSFDSSVGELIEKAYFSAYLLSLHENKNKIADLEKENAKLKTEYKVLSCSVGDFGELQDKLEEEQRKNNGLSDNLTKAKEIIKGLLDTQRRLDPYRDIFKDRILKAEQFLKDSEVEK